MSTDDLERELIRWRSQGDVRSSKEVRLSNDEAIAYRNRGNVPDHLGRTLRLVLHVDDPADIDSLNAKRLAFEPDFHDAPSWRRQGSRPVNVVPLRTGEAAPGRPQAWWDEPELGSLESEWEATGSVRGLRVPAEYRGFVFKTVLALEAAGRKITPDAVADSIARWLTPVEAERVRAALHHASRSH
jgi:hypothetical protein